MRCREACQGHGFPARTETCHAALDAISSLPSGPAMPSRAKVMPIQWNPSNRSNKNAADRLPGLAQGPFGRAGGPVSNRERRCPGPRRRSARALIRPGCALLPLGSPSPARPSDSCSRCSSPDRAALASRRPGMDYQSKRGSAGGIHRRTHGEARAIARSALTHPRRPRHHRRGQGSSAPLGTAGKGFLVTWKVSSTRSTRKDADPPRTLGCDGPRATTPGCVNLSSESGPADTGVNTLRSNARLRLPSPDSRPLRDLGPTWILSPIHPRSDSVVLGNARGDPTSLGGDSLSRNPDRAHG
jgi:hypothetical protein